MTSLKSTYRVQLTGFVVIHISVFIFVILKLWDLGNLDLSASAMKDSLLFAVAGPFLMLVVNGIFSPLFKTTLAYRRLNDPLPGSRAFMSPLIEDPRIDNSNLQSLVGEIPKDPSEQNKLWYQLLKAHEHDQSVAQSHRDWLFGRDLTGIAFLILMVFGPLALVALSVDKLSIVYVLLLLAQYFLLAVVASNYGDRFVCNVLATASANPKAS